MYQCFWSVIYQAFCLAGKAESLQAQISYDEIPGRSREWRCEVRAAGLRSNVMPEFISLCPNANIDWMQNTHVLACFDRCHTFLMMRFPLAAENDIAKWGSFFETTCLSWWRHVGTNSPFNAKRTWSRIRSPVAPLPPGPIMRFPVAAGDNGSYSDPWLSPSAY